MARKKMEDAGFVHGPVVSGDADPGVRKKIDEDVFTQPIREEKIVDFYPDPAGFDNPDEHESLSHVHVGDDNVERSVPDEGTAIEPKRKVSPEEAAAVNKAKLAHGDTDLVEAEPDEIPPSPEGSQPGPAVDPSGHV